MVEAPSSLQLDVTNEEWGLRVALKAQAVSAAEIIDKLALKTNMDIIITADVQIGYIDFKSASPQEALAQVVEAAGLTSRLVGKTYVIGKPSAETVPQKNPKIELYFRDIEIKELLLLLQEQFKIKVEVAPDVTGKLVAIHLVNETAQKAIAKIADGAGFSLEITDQDVYRVGFSKAPDASVAPID